MQNLGFLQQARSTKQYDSLSPPPQVEVISHTFDYFGGGRLVASDSEASECNGAKMRVVVTAKRKSSRLSTSSIHGRISIVSFYCKLSQSL
jgi:hypothetical protein